MKARLFFTVIGLAMFGLIAISLSGTAIPGSYSISSTSWVVLALLLIFMWLFAQVVEDNNFFYVTTLVFTLHLAGITFWGIGFDSVWSGIGAALLTCVVYIGAMGSLDLLGYVSAKDGSEPIWPRMDNAPDISGLNHVIIGGNYEARGKFSKKTSPWWHILTMNQLS